MSGARPLNDKIFTFQKNVPFYLYLMSASEQLKVARHKVEKFFLMVILLSEFNFTGDATWVIFA